jgi:hypothetical protein
LIQMVEHVQPIPEGVVPARAATARAARLLTGRFSSVLDESVLVPVVALYAVAMVGNLPREVLSDTWLVIVGGREVVHHGLPSHDFLTVWGRGHRWVDQQWLGQLVFYGLYALGGIKLALLGHVLALGSAFALAITLARRRGGSPRAVCWVALPVFFLLIWGSWNARAQSLAFVLFIAVAWLLARDARERSRRVFLVLPLLVLWANIHGTAVTGAALVAVAGISFGFEHRRERLRGWLPRSAVLVLAPFACLLVSPYALRLPAYYHSILFNPWFRDHVMEWQPTILSLRTTPFYLLAALAIWLVGRRRRSLLLTEKALLAVTLVMALQSIRGVVWFALLALIFLPATLDRTAATKSDARRFPLLIRALVAAILVVPVVVIGSVIAKPASWFEGAYPQGALAAVKRLEARDPHALVLASHQYGDWLLLRRPELRGRIAYDIRYEVVPQADLNRLTNLTALVDGWQRIAAPFRLFVLNTSDDAALGKALSRQLGARTVYRGHGVLVLYRPKGGSAK